MSGMFASAQQGPTRINGVQINQSQQGFPVIVAMGKGKVQQSLLWVDGFHFKKIDASGKGFGKGNQYVYSADVIAGLCDGGLKGILGVGDVWSGQSWLQNSITSESYTIAGSNPSYAPLNAGDMTGDHGVGYTVSLSASYPDLGAPAPTALATDLVVSFQRVDYAVGQTLAAGTYSVDTNNTYYFSTADVGTAIQINYTFSLKYVTRQENALIPSGKQIEVGGTIKFVGDVSVVYYSTGSDTSNNGKALTRVSGTPTVTGTYSVSGSAPATYKFATGDIDQEVQITYRLNNTDALPAGTQTSLQFELIPGTPTDSPAAILLTNYPGAALGYPGIAKALYTPMDLGYGAQIQQNVFEVITADGWGGGIPDCNPVQCIMQVLSNPVWGLGNGTVPFPLSAIDNSPAGTWGTGNAGNAGNGAGAYAAIVAAGGPVGRPRTGNTATAWFAANSFFISPVLDRQDSAASVIGRWLEAGMCAAFMSESLMKLVAYGDTSAAANGETWTAPSATVADLDDSDFVAKGENTDPVKISSSPWTEAFNKVQIGWNNRANQYAQEITPEEDKAAANRYGSRIEDVQSWDFITTLAAARFAGSLRVRRNVYTRNTYEFTARFHCGYLEPMDIISVTTAHAWLPAANNTIQLVKQPVRITKIIDNPDGSYDITAEDYTFGAAQPSAFAKMTAAGLPAPNQFADPGNTTAIVFEAPNRLAAFKGNQLWMGANGATNDWGGCNVWASMDGDSYRQIGTIDAPARAGTLAAAFATGSDPDTANSLVVTMLNGGALESGSDADADQGNTLCYVDGEIIAYSACAVSGLDEFTASGYIRRGQMGTAPAPHALGSVFLRLDGAVLMYTYDPSWAGKLVYLKFQSFNHYGNSAQDISALTAVTFTIPGANGGAFDATTGDALSVGGLPGRQIVQGLVNAGAVAAGTYGGGTYHQLTVSPSFSNQTAPPSSVSHTALLDGVTTTAVTWSLAGGSLGSVDSSGTWTPPASPPPHGGAGVLATLNSDSTVVGGASITW